LDSFLTRYDWMAGIGGLYDDTGREVSDSMTLPAHQVLIGPVCLGFLKAIPIFQVVSLARINEERLSWNEGED
jgi:hypothetical protein